MDNFLSPDFPSPVGVRKAAEEFSSETESETAPQTLEGFYRKAKRYMLVDAGLDCRLSVPLSDTMKNPPPENVMS